VNRARGGERDVTSIAGATDPSARAAAARAALDEARAATLRVVELLVDAGRHLEEERFDPRAAADALALLQTARALADAALRDAQERADLTLDAIAREPEGNQETERRTSGFQVPPAPRPAQRAPAASAVAPEQQRKPTS
jgi:hypothetical protein